MSKSPKGWHREDIKAAIRKRGTTLEALSEANGLDKRACSLALLRPYFSAEWVIAEFLGLSPRQIWPHRYDADGTYRHPKSATHHIRHGRTPQCRNGAAA